MWSIGIDVHQRSFAVCILDEHGKMVKQMKVRGTLAKLLDTLRSIAEPFAVCYEASCGYGHLHDLFGKQAKRVVVAHPGHLRLIFRTKKKNDRVDAKKLATLLFLDQVPTIHVPSVDVRSWRSLIEFRHRLVAKRTRVKNALRAVLRGHGVEQPLGKKLWTRCGVAWLAAVELPTRQIVLQRDVGVEELEHLETQIKRVEKELNAIAEGHAGVYLLRTIPGVGPRTAEAVVAYIDRADRFARNKQVGSYFGLVPSQDQTGDRDRLGHITREGPATVRKLLTEAAWQGIRRSSHIRAYFERVQGGDEQRKKIALIATAHYLVRVMHSMLRSGELWRFDGEKAERRADQQAA
jgi:transposase